MTRSEIVERLWRDSELYLSRADFERTLDGWEMHQVPGAVVLTKGPEFHFAVLDDSFQATREHLRRWPGELIARYGYAQTRTPKDDARQIRFNKRLGFEVVGEDEYDYQMRIAHLRVKDQACQSSL